MKNTIKTFALIFAAILLFAACAQQASSSSTPDINEPLFEDKDVPLAATKYELADGEWILRTKQKMSTDTRADQFEFAIKNGTLDISENAYMKYILSINGTFPEGTTEDLKENIKNKGYKVDGNKYSFNKEYDKAAISELVKKMKTNPDAANDNSPDAIAYKAINNGITAGLNLNNSSAPASCKTNEGKTKYMWTKNFRYSSSSSSAPEGTGTYTYYLAKK